MNDKLKDIEKQLIAQIDTFVRTEVSESKMEEVITKMIRDSFLNLINAYLREGE